MASYMRQIKFLANINYLHRHCFLSRYSSSKVIRKHIKILDPSEDKILDEEKFSRPATICETSNLSIGEKLSDKKVKLKPRLNQNNNQNYKPTVKNKKQPKTPNKKNTETELKFIDNIVVSEESMPFYERKKEKGAKIMGQILSLAKNCKLREERKEIVVEGKVLIKDAINAGIHLKSLFFSRKETVFGLPLINTNASLYHVKYKDIVLWSDLENSPGILGIFKTPKSTELNLSPDRISLTIICDEFQEPGELGTIIRSAAAAGCRMVICTTSCFDVWHSKVIRAGGGGHFKIPIISKVGWEFVGNYLESNTNVFLSEQFSDLHISKNLEDCNLSETDKPWYDVENIEGEEKKLDPNYLNLTSLDNYKKMLMTNLSLSQVNFGSGPSALVVGGKNEGLSSAAYKLLHDHQGCKITIPTECNMGNLTLAVAASIIIFEKKRQISLVN